MAVYFIDNVFGIYFHIRLQGCLYAKINFQYVHCIHNDKEIENYVLLPGHQD